MTIPNIITIARFLAIPAVVYALLHQNMVAALLLFVAAGLSDAVDGMIARSFNQRSVLGAWLDPMADKLLLVTVYVFLAIIGEMPDWLVILVVSRDLMIGGAVMLSYLLGSPVKIAPIMVSKANTAAQIALAALVLFRLAAGFPASVVELTLIAVTATLTLVSGLSYFVSWMRHMAGQADKS